MSDILRTIGAIGFGMLAIILLFLFIDVLKGKAHD